jgi:hypothetical protein
MRMVKKVDSDFDEDAAMEAAWERLAIPHPRDILKREYERELKGLPARCCARKTRLGVGGEDSS